MERTTPTTYCWRMTLEFRGTARKSDSSVNSPNYYTYLIDCFHLFFFLLPAFLVATRKYLKSNKHNFKVTGLSKDILFFSFPVVAQKFPTAKGAKFNT